MDTKYEVIITPRAVSSLEQIVAYLSEKASVQTAEKVRTKLLGALQTLSTMPKAHPVAQGIKSKQNIIYRRIHSMSYRIVYTLKEAKLQVLVVEIHHTARNPSVINRSFD